MDMKRGGRIVFCLYVSLLDKRSHSRIDCRLLKLHFSFFFEAILRGDAKYAFQSFLFYIYRTKLTPIPRIPSTPTLQLPFVNKHPNDKND